MHIRTGADLNCVTETHGCLVVFAVACIVCYLSLLLVNGSHKPSKLFWSELLFYFFIPSNTDACFPLTKSVRLQNIKSKLVCAFFLHFPIFFWQTRMLCHFNIKYIFVISLKLTLFPKDSVKTSMATFERLTVETNLTPITSSVS